MDVIISFLLLSIHVLNSEEDVFLEEVKTWRKSFFLWTYLFGARLLNLFSFSYLRKKIQSILLPATTNESGK